ncbi:MAG: hypothetical protein AcusKO_17770 [Acuticoccus sp.]
MPASAAPAASAAAATAPQMARAMEELGVRWFDEPATPQDRAAYREVRAKTAVPIAGGEAEFTRFGFRELIGGGRVDIIQPDPACSGGTTGRGSRRRRAGCAR